MNCENCKETLAEGRAVYCVGCVVSLQDSYAAHEELKEKQQTKLDLLLLKALGLENSILTPTQSVEDALEAFFSSEENRDWQASVSFDRVANWVGEPLWAVAIRGMIFQDKLKIIALTKAILWAVTEFSEEEVEQLFKRKEEKS